MGTAPKKLRTDTGRGRTVFNVAAVVSFGYAATMIARTLFQSLQQVELGLMLSIVFVCLCIGISVIFVVDDRFERRRSEALREAYLRKSEAFHMEMREYVRHQRELHDPKSGSNVASKDEEQWLTELLDEMEETRLATPAKAG